VIVNLRGTSGSGKSTLVRDVMAQYQQRNPIYQHGRKQPIGYCCDRDGGRSLFVVGHYETACGGCDTISDGMERIYYLINEDAALGRDVIYEGLIVQSDVRRCAELSRKYPLLVVAIEEPLEVCLAGIQARRAARGDERPLNPKNTIGKMNQMPRDMKRLETMGVDARRLNRAEARIAVFGALKLAL
jgi:hypothetical protein